MSSFARSCGLALGLALVLFAGDGLADPPAEQPAPFGPVSLTEGGTFFDQVDPRSGAMTYSYRFELPKARGLSGPSLALQYNSSAHDREAGYAWGLSLPSIELQPLSGLARFTATGTPLANGFGADHERYVFQGQSLVKICDVGAFCPVELWTEGHPAWASGWAYYRAQVEGLFARFYRSPDRASWRVQFKGGEVVDFGAPIGETYGLPPAIETKDTGIVRWRPVVEHDFEHPGNAIVYRWQHLGADPLLYLSDIYDTPSVGAATSISSFAHHAQLDWEAVPYRVANHQGADRAAPAHRLTRVAVTSMPWSGTGPREIYRVYRLAYYAQRDLAVYNPTTQGPLYHHSFLQQITMEGHCGAPTEGGDGTVPTSTQCSALPPVHFDYEAGATIGYAAQTSQISAGPANAIASHSVLPYPGNAVVVDFNQDGLPDVVQSWQSPCNYTKEVAVRDSGVSGQPELYCLNASAPYDFSIRSARPILGYLNGGTNGGAYNTFQYQCMDAGLLGDPNSIMAHSAGPYTDQENHLTKFFNANSNTVLGAFGSGSLGIWGRSGYAPFFARSIGQPSYAPGQAPPNYALGGCALDNSFDSSAFYPRWKWETRELGTWARAPYNRLGTTNDTPEWFVDIDGDGLADLLRPVEGLSSPVELRRATVSFTKKYGTGEITGSPGDPGPALLPIVDEPSPPINSLVPIAGQNGNLSGTWDPAPNGRKTQMFYADVTGDGLVDLITTNPADSLGLLRIRPGDGTGRFSCDPARDAWPCIPEAGAPDIFYVTVRAWT